MPIYISGTLGKTVVSGSNIDSLRNSTNISPQEQIARVEWGPGQYAVGTHYLGFSLPKNSIIKYLISGSAGSADSSLAVLTSSLSSAYPGQTSAVSDLAFSYSDIGLFLPTQVAVSPAESYRLMCSVGGEALTAGTASFLIYYLSGSAIT